MTSKESLDALAFKNIKAAMKEVFESEKAQGKAVESAIREVGGEAAKEEKIKRAEERSWKTRKETEIAEREAKRGQEAAEKWGEKEQITAEKKTLAEEKRRASAEKKLAEEEHNNEQPPSPSPSTTISTTSTTISTTAPTPCSFSEAKTPPNTTKKSTTNRSMTTVEFAVPVRVTPSSTSRAKKDQRLNILVTEEVGMALKEVWCLFLSSAVLERLCRADVN
ncbi:hypothetical protein K435DRAFT_967338 [Dendrothele bispora CBS 962.96]|uniref:Uncharacterized protein n=1 Tax=Dendrothele bispora (strain CBS 962.96) TaxID=1314807 RepID=A0A4S8LUV5_DENBC|nr:hypothetical protein K435DRAFT_967338 [Dendrothele bispora CBS 962.96]